MLPLLTRRSLAALLACAATARPQASPAKAPPVAAPRFWETKPPEQWTDQELEFMLTESPWAQAEMPGRQPVFLASARPVREAEEQRHLRWERRNETGPGEEDYRTYIARNPGKHIVVAVHAGIDEFTDPKEIKMMEKECYLRVGKKKIRMVGHFPPTPWDPYLRMLFPRVPLKGLKSLNIGLYLPGLLRPFRDVEFFLKDLEYRGQVEY